MEVGRLGASASNFPNANQYERWVVDLDARGTVSYRAAERWLFSFTLGLVVPLARDTFNVGPNDPPREVFRMSAVAGGGYFGLGYSF